MNWSTVPGSEGDAPAAEAVEDPPRAQSGFLLCFFLAGGVEGGGNFGIFHFDAASVDQTRPPASVGPVALRLARSHEIAREIRP